MKLSVTQKAALASYGRSVLATVLAAVLAGADTWAEIVTAFVAAAIPPIIRGLNPNDKSFGTGSK
jgi:hypothetical protein